MASKHYILFLGGSTNSLNLMAEGIVRQKNIDAVNVISANMNPSEPHPYAIKTMKEIGIDVDSLSLRTSEAVELFMFDLVITLGNFDQSCRPNLPGMPPHIHWQIPDPQDDLDNDLKLEQFRNARDILITKIETLLSSDLLHTLSVTRRNFQLILDNLLDGVMAHTTNRRIFYFNKAAENITGYNREEILGQDCHDIFPGRFCGGYCLFCETNSLNHINPSEKEVVFLTPDGEERFLHMATMPLSDPEGSQLGALILFKDNTELKSLKRRLKHHHSLGGMVGKDPAMLSLFNQIRELGAVNAPVLIEGESGTGKELVANAIHEISLRAQKPFVAINCGALPEGILESELFGHVRGAFTGAVHDKKGRFELADGGTLFLDEVGELSQAMQVKLLRVLQEQKFFRVGGEKAIQVDVRIISATNQNLRKLMKDKQFRSDLFYRLCVVPITLPTLRERKLDIPMLVERFVEIIGKETGRPVLTPSIEVLDTLTAYPWPGNVRELRNAIEYAYVKCYDDVIEVEHLPPEIVDYESKPSSRRGPAPKLTKAEVLKALADTEGNKKAAAKYLGIGRATLYRYLTNFNIPQ